MKLEKQQPTRSSWRIGPRWVELLVVSAPTVATGFFTGRVSERSDQADSPQPTATVTVQATATVTATLEATTTPTDTPTTFTGEGGSPDGENPDSSSPRPAQVFLADLDAVGYTGSNYGTSPVLMLGVNYPKSVRLGCDTSSSDSVTYDVSSYKRLKATLGIPSDAYNAIGSVAAIKVFDASGRQIADAVQFRSSDTADLSVDISGQDQIKITCSLVKSATRTAPRR